MTLYSLIVLAAIAAIVIFPVARILHRMGYSRWWSVFTVLPVFIFVLLWVLAIKKPWPAEAAKARVLEGEVIPAGKHRTSMGDVAIGLLGLVFMVCMIGISCAYIYHYVWAGFHGIEQGIGTGWAWAATIICFMGLTLPMTIGAFFGAQDLWGWPWYGALLFVMPGIAMIVPSLLFGTVRGAINFIRERLPGISA